MFFFYFEFSLIYFVSSHYKTVKKDFSVCKMIFFYFKETQTGRMSKSWNDSYPALCVYLLETFKASTLVQ